MAAGLTVTDLERESGIHHEEARSHPCELFEEQGAEPPESLTRSQADVFLAWHAMRYGTAG